MVHENGRAARTVGFLSVALLGSLALVGACGAIHTPLGWDDGGADGGSGTGGVKGTGGAASGMGGRTGGTGGQHAGVGGSLGTGGIAGGTGGDAGTSCGGFLGTPCPGDMICDLAAGLCGAADVGGTCVKVPSGCSRIFMPVCGCDGKTYSNDCERLTAKAQLDHTGSCDATGGEGSPCGGFSPNPPPPCNAGLFCELPSGSCLVADLGGNCRTVPQGCTQNYSPVCGCDGQTYANDCERRAARAQLDHTGVCEGPLPTPN